MIIQQIADFIKNNILISVSAGVSIIAFAVGIILIAKARKRKKARKAERYKKAVDFGASINIGRRNYQQDAYFIPDNIAAKERSEKGILCVLCDGMGGLDGGGIASVMCSETFGSDFYKAKQTDGVQNFFDSEIRSLDKKVASLTNADGERIRAGTTLLCALIRDGSLYWASAGDSRIYVIRGNEIVQLTRDHNYSLELEQDVKNGVISKKEANEHPQRESLISYVGMNGMNIIDINKNPLTLEVGDAVLLCSDGLYRSMGPSEILLIINEFKDDAQLAAHVLIGTAFDKDMPYQDNMCAVVMRYKK